MINVLNEDDAEENRLVASIFISVFVAVVVVVARPVVIGDEMML